MGKRLFVILSLLTLLRLPALGQTVYSNGPINGTTDAWTINSGFVVSDTFTVGGGGGSAGTLTFGAWAFPGDVLQSAQIQITSSEFGGTTFFSGTVNFTQSGCSSNQYGFNVCVETSGPFGPVNLASGTYWLNLDNAVVNTGDPIYWDENSGPSSASENSVGTIPSEAFTIGSCGGSKLLPDCLPPPSTPEPGSVALFATGMLSLGSFLRFKTRR